MKKILSVFMMAAILMSTVSACFAAETSFSDVPENTWYSEAVQYVNENDLMSGTGEGIFDPNIPVSRGMLVTVLWRQAGSPQAQSGADFTDAKDGQWYSEALDWAVENDVVNGYTDGSFGINDPVTREQFSTILWRLAGSPQTQIAGEIFSDWNAVSSYAKQAAAWIKENGLVTGKENNRFDPKGSATRAETAVIIYRRAQSLQSGGDAGNETGESVSSGSSGGSSSGGSGSSGGSSSGGTVPAPNPGDIPTPVDPAPGSASKVLIAYFSATNNTEGIANKIQTATGGDLFEIEPKEAYTAEDLNYNNSGSRANREQNDAAARPDILRTVSNLSDYDVIFVGYPIWHGQAPKVIYTFMESCSGWEGKTIVPFCTSGSSPIGSSASNLHNLISADAHWLSGNRFSAGASQDSISSWVESLGLNLNEGEKKTVINIKIGEHLLTAVLEDNSSAEALTELLAGGDITIDMSDYGNMEKVGSLPESLPRNDRQINTDAGDLILYQGNSFVIYYDKNSWSLTRLGKINNVTKEELREILGSGNVTAVLSLS